MNIEYIYNKVENIIKEKYGTKRWCYTDFFLDENGKKYFIEQIETDNEILPDWDDEEIIEHICNGISSSMFLYDMQQEMLSQ